MSSFGLELFPFGGELEGGLIEFYQLFDVLSTVAKSRHRVLSASLALLFEPIVEQTGACRHHF